MRVGDFRAAGIADPGRVRRIRAGRRPRLQIRPPTHCRLHDATHFLRQKGELDQSFLFPEVE